MLKRTLIGLVKSQESTGDKARDPQLRTKYYKLGFDRLWDEVVSLLKKLGGFKIIHEAKHVGDSLGEIIVEKRTVTGRRQDITITLVAVNPANTAVDIYSASRGSLGDLGSNYRNIILIYRELDKKLAAYKVE